MKKDFNIDDFLASYLMKSGGRLDDEEMEQFQAWLKESEENEEEFELLKKIFLERTRDPKLINADEIKERVWKKGVGAHVGSKKEGKVKSLNSRYLLKIVASILIFISVPFLLYEYFDLGNPAFRSANEKTEIVKQNPAGQKSQITLPDGSIVWLNAESSLQYTRQFGQIDRMVTLSGEAYFEVAKDVSLPFIVHTCNLEVMALGTAFNVASYQDEKNIEVALVEGRVMVTGQHEKHTQFHVLEPGKGIVYNPKRGTMDLFRFDPEHAEAIYGWKDGSLFFGGDDFEAFQRKIERWYAITVRVEGTPPRGWNIKGSFKNEYLDNVLKAVKYNKHFNYSINKNELTIKFNEVKL